ncbi:mycophenolic acid acyl-glucuronide mitochondrial [Micractinium conductrix]|uniref:Palmitoyl-protein thioesterase ABHD10, mitochondrial n=1 Tax=Micractinium conductrix TaxID=554055 RepID=A0A2P6VIR1_9CHLO|nr:mycophenolic acid acyl-glucuronide mitochondrial [Micractinium conductrix]|eukprot:PSC73985.1 mycophenolic acid acyl-glucuronide mitochondrial [Micractinium conductrix]
MPFLTRNGCNIAYMRKPAAWGMHADIVYLPGLTSNMHGEKARELERFATRQLGCNFWALEYQGHGDSSPNFLECTLATWLADVLQLVDSIGGQRQILVGSSLGGWLALHAALQRPHLVQGLLLLAPAVDVSQHWEAAAQPAGVDAWGHDLLQLPSAYVQEGGIQVRRSLFEEASRHHLLLHTGQLEAVTCPATIMHSIRDDVVPLELVQRLSDELAASSRAFHIEMLPDGNHRLSREQDLQLMCRLLEQLMRRVLESSPAFG